MIFRVVAPTFGSWRAHQVGIAKRKQMIDRDSKISITRQAELLDISRGAMCSEPVVVDAVELALMRRTDELHLAYPFVGARMLKRTLARDATIVRRRHLATLMRRVELEALAPKPVTSKARPGNKVYP